MALASMPTLFMSTAPLTPFLNCLSLRRFQHILMRQPQQASMMSSAATPMHITPQYGTTYSAGTLNLLTVIKVKEKYINVNLYSAL